MLLPGRPVPGPTWGARSQSSRNRPRPQSCPGHAPRLDSSDLPPSPHPRRMLTGVRAGGWLQAVRGLGNSCLAGPAPPCPPSMCVLPGPQGRPLSEHTTAPLFHQVLVPLSRLRSPVVGVARPRGAQVGVEPGTPAPQPPFALCGPQAPCSRTESPEPVSHPTAMCQPEIPRLP